MNKIIAFCYFVFWAMGVPAQNLLYSSLLIPDTLQENADEVVRSQQSEFIVKNSSQATETKKVIITVLGNESNANELYFSYDKYSKIKKLWAKVYDENGNEVNFFKLKEFNDRSYTDGFSIYSDNRYKHLTVSHSSYPYTIEYQCVTEHNGIMSYPNYLVNSFGKSVQSFEVKVVVPPGLGIISKLENVELEATVENEAGNKVYTWIGKNLPALKPEAYIPSHLRYPILRIEATKFAVDGYEGDMSTWKSFGSFMYQLNKNRQKLTPDTQEKIRSLTADAVTNQEKIKRIYQYMQAEVRYVSVQLGIGGWQSFDAQYVEKNKYGDCKALSNYMKSLLEVVDIPSDWVVIYSGYSGRKELDENFVNPGFGNHMILYVPSEDMFLECTSKNYPPNYIGGGNHDRPVLLINEEGGTLYRTPKYGLEENTSITRANINLDEKGGAVIKKQTTYHGPSHDKFRSIKEYPKSDVEKYIVRNTSLPALTLDKFEIETDENAPIATVDFNITVPRYASKAGKRVFVPINSLNLFTEIPEAEENRIHPIKIENNYHEKDEYIFDLPEGYKVESVPKEKTLLASDYGEFSLDIKVTDKTVTVTRILDIYAVELPAADYNKLRDFYKKIAQLDAAKMVLVKKAT